MIFLLSLLTTIAVFISTLIMLVRNAKDGFCRKQNVIVFLLLTACLILLSVTTIHNGIRYFTA